MTGIAFRHANANDVPAIRSLVERAYRGPEAARTWASEANLLAGPRTTEDEIAALIARQDCRFVLARRDGRLIGCALIEQHGENGYFGMFSIDPGLQNGGLGKVLLGHLEQSVRELWGAKAMTMVVINLRDDLIAWYRRRGYEFTGRREPFPFGPNTGELRRDFDLVELRKAL